MLVQALVSQSVGDTRLLGFEIREELSRALLFELHNVEARLRANRGLSHFTFLQSGKRRAEGSNELTGNHPTELAALILAALVFAEFLGELIKVRALFEALEDVLGLIFGLHEDGR